MGDKMPPTDGEAELESADDIATTWGAATRGPAGQIDPLIGRYLGIGEPALAWHLARLAEARGMEPGVPAGILRALAGAPCVTGPYDVAATELSELFAEAVTAVGSSEELDDELADRASALIFAALLRQPLWPATQVRGSTW